MRTPLLLTSLLLLAAPARAAELWTSADGANALEGRAFYKTMGSVLHLPAGLVDATDALRALVEATRATLPPSLADQLPEMTALPHDAAMSAHTARVWGRLLLGERLELAAGWQLDALVSSAAGLTEGGLGVVPAGAAQQASRRLVDFDPILLRDGGLRVTHNLDLLAAKAKLPFGDLTLGRQILSWGTGRLWNPTDLLSPFSPTDVDREVRRGVDALRLSLPLGSTTVVDLLWLPQDSLADQGGVLRGRTNLGGYDFSLSVAKYVRDLVLGADFAGDLGPLGVHGEGAWTTALEGLDQGEVRAGTAFLRAVAGLDWRPTDELVLMAEYYYNGWGADRPERYLSVLGSDRVRRGEVFGAGRHYAGVVAAWAASELLNVQAVVLANLRDPSAIAMPVVEYWFEQSVIVRAGGYLPLGRGADPSPLRALVPTDLLTRSPAFVQATSTLGLRSEYGASPLGLFAQAGIYF